MADDDSITQSTSGTLVADRVDGMLDGVGRALHQDGFETLVRRMTTIGHWSLLIVAVVGLVIQLVAAAVGSGTSILWGIAWLIVLPLLQYTAVQFMDATRTLVISNTSSLGSSTFLRCYALVALIVGIVALVGGIAWGIELGSLHVFLVHLVIAALSVGTVWLALHPALLAIRVDRQTNAGEEALGVLSFFVKAGVRLVPIFYGVTMLLSAILGIIILLGMMGSSQVELLAAVSRAELTVPIILWAVLSPFLAYIAFVVYYLAIDLMRSILSIPRAMSGAAGSRGTTTSRKKTGRAGGTASKKKSSGRSSGSTE